MFTLLLSLNMKTFFTSKRTNRHNVRGVTSFQVGITLNVHGIVFHWCEIMDLKDVKILTIAIKKAFKVYMTPTFKNMIKTSMYIHVLLCGFLVLRCMVVFETRVQ